jgi:hypothetical protein
MTLDFAAVFPTLEWSTPVPGRPDIYYRLSGSVAVAVAGCLSQAFDGLATAALAVKHENNDATTVALQYIHARLDAIYETLLAVIGEQEDQHGSSRPS